VVRVSGSSSRGRGFDSRRYQTFWEVVGLERGPLSLVSTIEELLERKSSDSGLESQEHGRGDPSCWPHGTLYPRKFALTSLTRGGLSVGIVRSQTQTTEFGLSFYEMTLSVHHTSYLVQNTMLSKNRNWKSFRNKLKKIHEAFAWSASRLWRVASIFSNRPRVSSCWASTASLPVYLNAQRSTLVQVRAGSVFKTRVQRTKYQHVNSGSWRSGKSARGVVNLRLKGLNVQLTAYHDWTLMHRWRHQQYCTQPFEGLR
jgi:hypothetical protein